MYLYKCIKLKVSVSKLNVQVLYYTTLTGILMTVQNQKHSLQTNIFTDFLQASLQSAV